MEQLKLSLEHPHRNHYLFSDHYLNQLLPHRDPRWDPAGPPATTFYTWLTAIYRKEADHLPGYNENQLEEHWIKPILHQLGHVYEPQVVIPGLEKGIKQPDYVFFPDEAARQAVVSAQNTQEYAEKALAVGDAKKWTVRLGKKQKGGSPYFSDQNPMWQIDHYLRLTGRDWGLLTNGRRWRLVHQDTSQRLTIYYEVDLEELLVTKDPADMRYFTLFFGAQAFRPDAQGRIFLQNALDQSRRYALELEEDLQENTYEALRWLMQGFLDCADNGLGADDLPAIYQNSLYLLYRLLFILYAESRGLLPMQNDQYRRHHSLEDIKHEIQQDNVSRLPMTNEVWNKLKRLFTIINGDHPQMNKLLGVPRYNGGLFNPELHPFLEQYQVGDEGLVHAVDLLSRRQADTGRESVDYRTLGVRQLGSIYEGLLEYQPKLEGTAVILQTDKGERKATGSYYTPEYIVKYIVENTLGPLVEEATQRVQARGEQVAGAKAKAAAAQTLVDEILNIKVLDPAMGSGHFLVEATDYLALALATDPYVETAGTAEEDVAYWRRRVVERCIYGVDKNPLAVELAKLSLWLATVAEDRPLSFLDHHLKCGDALVGARVRDVGWEPPVLHSKRAQKQLEARRAGQMNLFEYRLAQQLPAVMSRVLEIMGQESDSYESVQAKEAADEAVRQLKAPFIAVADLWTSAYFDHDFTVDEYGRALEAVGKPDQLFAMPAVQQAETVAQNRRFFHWELAFPEVFYDEHGQHKGETAGFHAVIGNPPYVRQEGMGDLKPFFSISYAVYSGTADLYVYFYQQSTDLLQINGRTSMIVTNKWLKASYGQALRKYLVDNCKIEEIIDFGHSPIFYDVDVFPCIVTLQKVTKMSNISHRTLVSLFPREKLGEATVSEYVRKHSYFVSSKRFNERAWGLEREEVKEIMQCIRDNGIYLMNYIEEKVFAGIKTGFNNAFLIDNNKKESLIEINAHSKDLLFPYLRGQDIERWLPDWSELWLIRLKSSDNQEWPWSEQSEEEAENIFSQCYPAIYDFFLPFKNRLKKRWDQGRFWWELRSCTYYEYFERPKIIYQEIQFHSAYCFDETGYLTNNKGFIIPSNDLYLLAVLNSPLMWWFNWRYLPHMKDEALSPKGELMENLPIAIPTDEIRKKVEQRVNNLLQQTAEKKHTKKLFLDWLQGEFKIQVDGQKISNFEILSWKEFLDEVRKNKSGKKGFSPIQIGELNKVHEEYSTKIKAIISQMSTNEKQISQSVNQAYRLNEEQVSWIWKTAPPRMPEKV